MPKAEQQPSLDLYAPLRKRDLVVSMADLVEDRNHHVLIEKFWQRVRRGSTGECWEWTGAKTRRGYGNFYIGKLRYYLAHRFSFLVDNGSIDPVLGVLHSCDNKPCMNPAHLSQGTILENNQQAWARRLMPRGELAGMATIPETVVVAIRREYSNGLATMREVGNMFGVHCSQVCRIVNYTSRRIAS